MASTLDFVTYVIEQIQGVGVITYRKMFGEYMIYVDDKPTLLVCDNQVYIKRIEALQDDMIHLDTGYPYEGAKLHYCLNPDQKDEMKMMIGKIIPHLKTNVKKVR